MNIAILLSGGVGTRLRSDIPKQYVSVAGRMIVSHCLETLCRHPMIDVVQIVAAEIWRDDIMRECPFREKLKGFSVPGENRQLSILNGLRDVASFAPDIVIITLGGNDCNPKPEKFVSASDFVKNMSEIVRRVRELGALPIIQTYYKMDLEAMVPERAENFVKYMELVREAARQNDVFLVDQYKLFEAFPPAVLRYKLLLNAMHTNDLGNAVIGVNLLKHLGIDAAMIDHNENLCAALNLYKQIAG